MKAHLVPTLPHSFTTIALSSVITVNCYPPLHQPISITMCQHTLIDKTAIPYTYLYDIEGITTMPVSLTATFVDEVTP